MNRIRIILAVLFTLGLFVGLGGCVKQDFEPPKKYEIPLGHVMTIQDLQDFCPPGNVHRFTGDTSVVAVVAMDDKSGNLYKEVFIQDANSGAVARLQSSGGLYQGDSIYINLKGTTLKRYRKLFQIDSVHVDKNVVKRAVGKEVEPKLVTIPELKAVLDYTAQLIKLENVQFVVSDISKTYADSENLEYGELTLQDENYNRAKVRTSGYAKFADTNVPDGMGSIIAIASRYDDELQLLIRSTDEVVFNQTRWDMFEGYSRITIADCKDLYTGSTAQITDDIYVEGVVISDDESGNYYKMLVINDGTSGIEVKIDQDDLNEEYPVGTKIRVRLNGLYIGAYGGQVQIGGLYNGNVGFINSSQIGAHIEISETELEVVPTLLTIDEITDEHIGSLIRLDNVEFISSQLGQTFANEGSTTNRTLKDCSNNQIVVRTSNYAEFADATLPPGNGTFIAVLSKYNSTYQLYLRYLWDADLFGERCQ
jgi:hypothetical protein